MPRQRWFAHRRGSVAAPYGLAMVAQGVGADQDLTRLPITRLTLASASNPWRSKCSLALAPATFSLGSGRTTYMRQDQHGIGNRTKEGSFSNRRQHQRALVADCAPEEAMRTGRLALSTDPGRQSRPAPRRRAGSVHRQGGRRAHVMRRRCRPARLRMWDTWMA